MKITGKTPGGDTLKTPWELVQLVGFITLADSGVCIRFWVKSGSRPPLAAACFRCLGHRAQPPKVIKRHSRKSQDPTGRNSGKHLFPSSFLSIRVSAEF